MSEAQVGTHSSADSVPTQDIVNELNRPESGPRPTTSLQARRSPLADPVRQIAALEQVALDHLSSAGDFDAAVAGGGEEQTHGA